MKKAQIETMGLVIIVTLLAFILVFVLQINSKPNQNGINDHYLQLNADNLRSTILKTSLCEDSNIKDELVSCNNFDRTSCETTCNELKDTIKLIIMNSLNTTRNYKFMAGNFLLEKGTCKNVYASASEPIPNSEVNIKLEVC